MAKKNILATPFTDTKALDRWSSEVDGLKDIIESHRAIATEVLGLETDVSIVWEIPSMFRLIDGPTLGPCHKSWEYISNMIDQTVLNEATDHCLTFMAPRFVSECTRKNVKKQMRILSKYRRKYDLPRHHLSGYGKVCLIANIVLSHHCVNNERIPLNYNWTRTDTFTKSNSNIRLDLGNFGTSGLGCDWWSCDSGGYPDLGCFAIGVEELGD